MRVVGPRWAALACAGVAVVAQLGCSKDKAAGDAKGEVAPELPTTRKVYAAAKDGVPQLAVMALEALVYEKPDRSSAKIGLLRLGEILERGAEPVSRAGCPGGFYEVKPRGFVCVNDEHVTLDVQHPIVRAAHVRPDRERPLPYAYAFVRAVAPQYLRVPNAAEQEQSEFKLKEHLEWYGRHHQEIDQLSPGANDLELPAQFPPTQHKSVDLKLGQRFGAEEDFDPWPFWLEGGKRSIPNVSTFKVPPSSIFADRTRRYTGLSLVGALKTGPEHLDRGFAITTDLRLVPITKLKPESGSQWHGVEIDGQALKLPFAFVRLPCDEKAPQSCPHSYRFNEAGEPTKVAKLAWRSVVKLTGNAKNVGDARYRELEGGLWAKALDLGAVMEPTEWPAGARKDEKWIEVSIYNQTLTLWQGKTPLFATLVSTGQDGMGDPKTSKSTVRGEFRVKNKFITSTMDSNEGRGGERNPEEGKTIRRGANNFELRDVPYVQFFEGAYALHVAYWHDVFGQPRSHGCINISPVDGLRVFKFTEPHVPESWHGIYVNNPNEGTWVVVHR